MTLYEGAGWLVKNAANRWSIPAHAATRHDDGTWSFTVSPDEQPGAWLPTGGVEAFDLTLAALSPGAGNAGRAGKGAVADHPAAGVPMMRRWFLPLLVAAITAWGAYQAALLLTPFALMRVAMSKI